MTQTTNTDVLKIVKPNILHKNIKFSGNSVRM